MIYTGLNRTGEIETVKAHGGADVAEVYGGINESNPIYYKTRTLTGTSPLSYKALSKPISDYLISGNTIQNGTPAPDAPVDVVGCGDRTENLFDGIIGTDNKILGEQGRTDTNYAYALSKYIPVEPNTSYIYHFYHNIAENRSTYSISEYDSNKNVILPMTLQWITENKDYSINFTTRSNTAYIRINWKKAPDENLMLNTGSTALPYEPYGYKLPITVNGQEIPIYLGQVPTTRKTRKLVFKGTENWKEAPASTGYMFSIGVNDGVQSDTTVGIKSYCSHFQIVGTGQTFTTTNSYTISADLAFVCRIDSSYTLETFKAFLAAQYANGTPVTLLYRLATEATGIVNDPLHKIGNYADTVSMAQSGVSISTTAGTNTLLVDTTVQPSAVSITGNIKEVSR